MYIKMKILEKMLNQLKIHNVKAIKSIKESLTEENNLEIIVPAEIESGIKDFYFCYSTGNLLRIEN